MITGKDGAWIVKSEDGTKHLGGPYKTKGEAEKRLKQVEWFKSHPKESFIEAGSVEDEPRDERGQWTTGGSGEGIRELKISQIRPSLAEEGKQSEEKVQSMVQAIKNGEDLGPIEVKQVADGKYEVTDGHHRFEAAKLAGKTKIDAVLSEKPRFKESAMEKIVFIDAMRGVKVILLDEKFLVTDKDGTGHLPVDDAGHMGAAWAALHGGYRGNKYEGPDKSKAIAKLKAMYKMKGMDTPSESFAITGGSFFQEALAKDDSYDSLRCKVQCELENQVKAGNDMDLDNDGAEDAANWNTDEREYPCVMDLFPGYVVYQMDGKLFQAGYALDADGDVHLGPPEAVQLQYDAKQPSMHAEESFTESFCPLSEAASADGSFPITIIKPGLSKNNRYYSPELLKKHASMFEGAKMFANHATDKEMKERPEGSVNDWVANLVNIKAESDGTLRGNAVPVDPAFKSKLDLLAKQGLLGHMGVSIRAMGESVDGEVGGKPARIVENFKAVRSVDFVTFAGAGGAVEA